jgi:predicted GH43/DUF377 family glycosyl hydrolase
VSSIRVQPLFQMEPPCCCAAWRTAAVIPIYAPERHGDVDKVVFPCGYTLGPDGDTLRIYYGAADASIAMATGSVQALQLLIERG